MTRTVFLCFLLLSIHGVFADVEPAIYFKGTIEIQSGKSVSGYFRVPGLYIGEWEGRFSYAELGVEMFIRTSSDSVDGIFKVYPTEYHFSNAVKRVLRLADTPTVEIFQHAVLLRLQNSSVYVPVFLGSPVQIKSGEINDLTIEIIHSFTAGESALTSLTIDDKEWLSMAPQHFQTLGRVDMCEYTAYLFGPGDISVDGELKTLKSLLTKMNSARNEQQYAQLQLKVNREVERLKNLRILIWAWCSC